MVSLRFPGSVFGNKKGSGSDAWARFPELVFCSVFSIAKGKLFCPKQGKRDCPLTWPLFPLDKIFLSISQFNYLYIYFISLFIYIPSPAHLFRLFQYQNSITMILKNSDWVYLTVIIIHEAFRFQAFSVRIVHYFISPLNSFFLSNCNPHYIASAICQ